LGNIICTSFFGDPKEDDIGSENFTIIHFMKKIILIGGIAYLKINPASDYVYISAKVVFGHF